MDSLVISNPVLDDQFHFVRTIEGVVYYVYFLWMDDDLVYIGQTVNLTCRVGNHLSGKCFNRVTYKEFKNTTIERILEIESSNINHYKPFFNVKGNKLYKRPQFMQEKGGERYDTGIVYYYCDCQDREDPDAMHYYHCYNGHNLMTYCVESNYVSYKIDNEVVKSVQYDAPVIIKCQYDSEAKKLNVKVRYKPS